MSYTLLQGGAAVYSLGYAPLSPFNNLSDLTSVPAAQAVLGAGAAIVALVVAVLVIHHKNKKKGGR